MSQPVLHTERLTLVPLGDEHLEDEIALDASPEVMRYLGHGVPRGREEVIATHAQRLHRTRQRPGLGFWAGLLDGAFTGWWLLDPDGASDDEAELGYRLRPEFWRRGLATEGSQELLRHAFDDLGLRRVYAQTMAVNEGSRAVMTGLGLGYVRTFHDEQEVPIPGSEQGEVEYAITRDEWRRR